MASAIPAVEFETAADLHERLGNIPLHRIRMKPLPGTATEKDLLDLLEHGDRLYELIDGTLVEKTMGWAESALALRIGRLLGKFVDEHDLGDLTGADGATRLMPGLVRIPDISFVSWARLPGRKHPTEPVPGLCPNLAIEVLSEGNTPGEMTRKLKEYFLSDVRLVWFVDLRKRTVQVFTAPDHSATLTEDQTLDGGDVLPEFTLAVREIFARAPHFEPKPVRKKRAAPRTSKPRRKPPS
jgi:Uma2 family endonuclease